MFELKRWTHHHALTVLAAFVVTASPGLLMASEGEASSPETTQSWTSNDGFSLGIALPPPIVGCDSVEDGGECRVISSMGVALRLELARYRFENFQFELAHVFMGMDWSGREHMGFGLAGVGHHWRIDDEGDHETGYLVWPVSIFMDDAWGNLTTQAYYRYNGDHSFIEVGIAFCPYWNSSPLGNAKMELRDFPFHIYVQSGLPTAELGRLWDETFSWAN